MTNKSSTSTKRLPTKSSAPPKPVARGVSAAAFEAFFEMIDRPAALCDADLVVLAANPAFETLCGHSAVVGKPLRGLVQSIPKLPASVAFVRFRK